MYCLKHPLHVGEVRPDATTYLQMIRAAASVADPEGHDKQMETPKSTRPCPVLGRESLPLVSAGVGGFRLNQLIPLDFACAAMT